MDKIKVLSFIPMLSDGGAETLVVNYAHLIDKTQFEPIILSVHKKESTANFKRINGSAKIISVYKTNSLLKKIAYRLWRDQYVPFQIKRVIEREKPDVIHVHLQILKYILPIAESLKGIRLFYTCHNEPQYMFDGAQSQEKDAAQHLINHYGLKMIALHEDMREELNHLFEIDNSIVIKNGVDFNKFRNIPKTKEEIRRGLGIPADAFLLGHIGRYTEQKNHEFLIEIFRETVKKKPNAYLLLIGTGEKFDQIEALVQLHGLKEKVKMFRCRTDIPELFKAMDVFVFPSLFEGLSVTMVEAQAAGVRCVVSDRINKATFLSSKTIAFSLNEPSDLWADAVLNMDLTSNETYGILDDYDLNKEIKKLENLYKGEI